MTRTSSTSANEHGGDDGLYGDGGDPPPPLATTDGSTSTVLGTRSTSPNVVSTSPRSCSTSTFSNSTYSSPLLPVSFSNSYPSSPVLTSSASNSSTGAQSFHEYALAASTSTSASRHGSTWSSSPHHPTHWASPVPTDSSLDDQWHATMMTSATGQSPPMLSNTSNRMDREALLKSGWSRDRQPRFHHPQPALQSSSSSPYEHSSPSRSTATALHDSPPSPHVPNSMPNFSHLSSPHRSRMESNASWLINDDFDDDLYSLFGAHFNPHHHSTNSSDHTLRASKKSRQDAAHHDRDQSSPVSGFKSLGQKASKFSLRSIASAMSLPTSSSASATSSTRTGIASSNTSFNASTMTTSPSITSFHPYPSPPNSPNSKATSSLSPSRRPSKASSSNSCLSPLPLPLAIPPSLEAIDPPTISHSWSEAQPGGVRGKAARILGEVTVPTGKAARLLGTEQGPQQVKIGVAGGSSTGAGKSTGKKGMKGDRAWIGDHSSVYSSDDDDTSFDPRHPHATGGLLKSHRSSIELLTPEHSPPLSSPIRALLRSSSENELGRVRAQARGRQPDGSCETDEDASSDVFTKGHAPFNKQWKKLPHPPSPSPLPLSTITETQSTSTTPHLSRRGSIDSLVDSTYHQSWTPRARSNGRASVVPSLASIALPSIRSSFASTVGGSESGRGEGSMRSWDGEDGLGFGRSLSRGSSWREDDEDPSPRTPRTPTTSTRFRSSTYDSSIYSTTSSLGRGQRSSSLHSSEGSLLRAQERAKSLLGPPRSMPPMGELPPLPVPTMPLPSIPDGINVVLTTKTTTTTTTTKTGIGEEKKLEDRASMGSVGRRSQRGHALEALEGRREVGRRSIGQGMGSRSLGLDRKSVGRRMSTLPGDGEDEEEELQELEDLIGFKRESRPFLDLGEEEGESDTDEVEGGQACYQGADSDSDTMSEFPNRGAGSRMCSVDTAGSTTQPPRASEFIKGQVLFNPSLTQRTSTDKIKDPSEWVELRADLLLEALDRTQAELRKVNPFPTDEEHDGDEEEEDRSQDFSPTMPTTPFSRPSLNRGSSSFHSDEQSEVEGFSPALGKLVEFFNEDEQGIE